METSQLDFLGELRRTHTCGELRVGRHRPARRSDGLGASPPRSRRSDLHSSARPRMASRSWSSAPTRDPELFKKAESLGSEYVIAAEGVVEQAHAGDRQLRDPNRRSRNGRRQALDPERIAHAAIPDGRNGRRERRRAAEVSLCGSAAPAHAAQYHSAFENCVRDSPVAHRAGIPGNRNAVHDALDARRRARLSGAQPRAAGLVLCAAAIAADL